MRYLGCWVSASGGFDKAVERAEALGINTMMVHAAPPQRWATQEPNSERVGKYDEARSKSGLEKVFLHGIYLVNLANPDKQKFHLSKISLVNHLKLSSMLNSDGVIFHPGSFTDVKSEAEGFKRMVFGINWVLKHANNNARLILESTAGAGKVVGSKFEELKRIYDGVEQKERIKFCLDTQHMFAAGYDLLGDLDDVVIEIDRVLGLENIVVIHLNDTLTELGSNKDRHADLGEGLLGEKGIRNVLNHPKLKEIPFLLETPSLKTTSGSEKEVRKLKGWAS